VCDSVYFNTRAFVGIIYKIHIYMSETTSHSFVRMAQVLLSVYNTAICGDITLTEQCI